MSDEELSPEAHALYQLFDSLVTDDWTDVHSYAAYVAPIARWLPPPKWRTLWHELGAHHMLAYSVRSGTDCVSRWRDRYPSNPKDHLLTQTVFANLEARYADWTTFCWDAWNEFLLWCGIQTEALWQLNNAFLILSHAGVLETRNSGTEIRVTPESAKWKLNKAST